MKKIVFSFAVGAFLLSCNNSGEKTASTTTDSSTASSVDLPYSASYSSNFTQDVSDADLKLVMQSYKDWESGNMSALGSVMGDSVEVDFNNGDHFKGTNANLMKIWSTFRDSLSSATIEMEGWHKMYEPVKKEAFVVTWYKEIDTYKMGKVDSAWYHDINEVKNGKITYYRQYKRPAK
jgi:ketosteroid isomerase-like protein